MQILHVAYGLLAMLAVNAVALDPKDEESICAAAKVIIDGQMNYYEGIKYGGTVGMFTTPYYWWHAGETFGGWVDYFTFCASDNSTFENLLFDAMYHQAGADFNYIPSNQSMTEGNDDQGVWGMAIIQAVERNFTDPGDHSWLSMVQAIYNTMDARWDDTTCGGGLRWQIFTWNSGYNYKNAIANGCLFHIAARLYRYTGLDMYLETAEKVWDWMWDVRFILDDPFIIYDGADDADNCTDVTVHKWSYTYGIFLSGCANLYNKTEDDVWKTRTEMILDASAFFFNGTIMTEMTCATPTGNRCNNDQRSFRSLFARSLGLTAALVPSTYDQIYNGYIVPSAEAAAQSCSGGSDGVTCGFNWGFPGWDGYYGLGEQIGAGEVVMTLITANHPPLTPETGGTSESVPSFGNTTSATAHNPNVITVTTGDKAGAGVLTGVVLGATLAAAVWMLF